MIPFDHSYMQLGQKRARLILPEMRANTRHFCRCRHSVEINRGFFYTTMITAIGINFGNLYQDE